MSLAHRTLASVAGVGLALLTFQGATARAAVVLISDNFDAGTSFIDGYTGAPAVQTVDAPAVPPGASGKVGEIIAPTGGFHRIVSYSGTGVRLPVDVKQLDYSFIVALDPSVTIQNEIVRADFIFSKTDWSATTEWNGTWTTYNTASDNAAFRSNSGSFMIPEGYEGGILRSFEIQLFNAPTAAVAYVDNVTVSYQVPEPASLGLGAIVVAGLMRRRRSVQ
jgi:hypothetical protein